MHHASSFAVQHISPVMTGQVQPSGVGLTLETVLEQVESGRLGRKEKTVGERRAFDCIDSNTETYRLDPGGYVLQYAETIRVSEDHVGLVYLRSSLMWNSYMLNTAVWDAGYEGRGEDLLEIRHLVELERGVHVAQVVLADTTHNKTYDGSYQDERIR